MYTQGHTFTRDKYRVTSFVPNTDIQKHKTGGGAKLQQKTDNQTHAMRETCHLQPAGVNGKKQKAKHKDKAAAASQLHSGEGGSDLIDTSLICFDIFISL